MSGRSSVYLCAACLLSVHSSVCLSTRLSVYPSVYLSACLSCLSACPFVCPSVRLSVCRSFSLPIYLLVCLFACLSECQSLELVLHFYSLIQNRKIYLFVSLSIFLLVYLSVYMFHVCLPLCPLLSQAIPIPNRTILHYTFLSPHFSRIDHSRIS